MNVDPLLKAGVTEARVDAETAAAWAAASHQALREAHGRVLGSVIPPGQAFNYYLLRVQLEDGQRLRLMLNATIGLVGAADDTDELRLVKEFRDVPRPDVFGYFGFRVATPAQLEAPLTHDQAAALTAAERRDVDYHNPQRVGDVVFNWFD